MGNNKDTKFDNLSTDEKNTAMLDLVFLERICSSMNIKTPENLFKMTTDYADKLDRPASLTYQDLIAMKPNNDKRLFSNGETVKWEKIFYQTNINIENSGFKTANLLLKIFQSGELTQENYERLVSEFDEFKNVVEQITKITKEMPSSEFLKFRKYYRPNDERNIGGPSALYSALFPLLDTILQSEVPEQRFDIDLLPKFHLQNNPKYITNIELKES